jgi:hypothetical protein
MKNKKSLYIIILVLIVIVGAIFFLSNNKSVKEETQAPANENEMVDCGQAKDPGCFMNRMNGCLPVTTKMMGSDGKTSIDITILGVENEKCHFQRKVNDVMDLDCQFSKGTFNSDILDQIFGNDKGLQEVVDNACATTGY